MKLLVTGATGFIGAQVLSLLDPEVEVHVLSRNQADLGSATVHVGSFLDTENTSKLVKHLKPTHVLHLAWEATPGTYRSDPINHEWKEATLECLKTCIETGVQRFVGAGTGTTLGSGGRTSS